MPSVLSMSSFPPVAASNLLIISVKLLVTDRSSAVNVSVASSAYWLILPWTVVPGIFTTSMCVSLRIAFPNVSAMMV